MAEVVIQEALMKKYNQLIKQGRFVRREVYGKTANKSICESRFVLRTPKIFGVKLNPNIAAENRIYMELVDSPDFASLYDFIADGISHKGKQVDLQCSRFIKNNNLEFQMKTKERRIILARHLDNALGRMGANLSIAGEEVIQDRRKKQLNSGFGFDFQGMFGGIVSENFLVEKIDSKGILHFVLIDSLKAAQDIYGLPELSKKEIERVKKLRISK